MRVGGEREEVYTNEGGRGWEERVRRVEGEKEEGGSSEESRGNGRRV